MDIFTQNTFIKKAISFLFIFLTFPSIGQWLNIHIGNTTIWWFIETTFLLLIYLFTFSYYFVEKFNWNKIRKKLITYFYLSTKNNNKKSILRLLYLIKESKRNPVPNLHFPIPILIYICYIFFSIIHGCLKATSYWDWKILYNNSMIFLLPIIVIYFSVPSNLKKACHSWISFAIVFFWLLLPIMQPECPARFLFPFAFFIIFWPYFNKKGVIFCLIAVICVFVFGSLGARSSAIRFIASIGFSLFLLIKRYIPKILCISFSTCIMAIPFILLILGLSGQFNIFKIGEYIDLDIKVTNSMVEGASENLSTDTRTFLYEETISSAIEHDYYLLGNSLSQGYYSKAFAYADENEGRGMRYSTEVGILNVFTYLGIIGVFLYFSIFVYSIANVYLHSNNKSLYVVALLLSFRWLFCFLEEFTYFDTNMVFLWVEISMCNSPYFLRMNDTQFKLWAKNLLTN